MVKDTFENCLYSLDFPIQMITIYVLIAGVIQTYFLELVVVSKPCWFLLGLQHLEKFISWRNPAVKKTKNWFQIIT